VSDVNTILAVGQEVQAYVVSLDEEKKRFGLSLKKPQADGEEAGAGGAREARVATRAALKPRGERSGEPAKPLTAKRGDWVEGTVKAVMAFGAIVEVEEGISGLLHVSEMSGTLRMRIRRLAGSLTDAMVVCSPADNPDAKPDTIVKEGDKIKVRIDKVEKEKGAEKIRLSMMEHFDLKAMNEVVPIQAGMTAMAYAFAKAGFNPAAAAEKQAAEDKAAAKKLAAERAAEALLVRAAAEAAAAEEAARAEAQAAAVQAAAAAAEKAARAEAEAKAAAEAQAEAKAAAAAEAQAKAAAEAKAQAAAAAEAQAKADAAAAAAPAAEEKPKADNKKAAAPAAAAAAAPAPAAVASAVAVSSADVKILRDKSGAGMMDCKKALAENGNDMEAASEWLRKKGLASAAKKGARVAAEGAVGSYIHAGARIGVLVELNCETDFVARGEVFQTLLKDLAMQIAACPDVQVVDTSDVDEAWKAKETEIEMGKEDILSKPEKLRAQIVVGRVAKRVNEVALLEQAYIRDTDKKVGDLIKEKISEIGENIKVRRFSRFNLGEGIEKKENDFAAEVAAITGAK